MHFFKNTFLHNNISHAVYKSPYLYYTHNLKLSKYNTSKNQQPEIVKDVETINLISLDFIEDELIFIYQDKIVWKENTIYVIVKKYVIYQKLLMILNNKNQIVVVKCNSSYILCENVIDFTVDNYHLWIISTDYKIYKKYFYESITHINLNNPLNIINISNKSLMVQIEVNKNIYLFYKNCVEVFDILNDILVLKYRYNTKNYNIYNLNKLYLVDNDTLELCEYPKIILKGKIDYAYKDKDKDIIISKENIIYIQKEVNKIQENYKNSNKWNSVLDNLKTTFVIDSSDEKYIYKKFEEEVLDRYRKMYYELTTLNDSLLLKKNKLEELFEKVNIKIKKYEKRKLDIEKRIKDVSNRYYNVLSTVKVNAKDFYKILDILKNEIGKKTGLNNEKYVRMLKMQKELLKNKIYKSI